MIIDTDKFVYALVTLGWIQQRITRHIETQEIVEYVEDSNRTIAICDDIEYLKLIVETNSCDIHEGVYKYAMIEKVYQGLYGKAEKVKWYEWIPEEGGDRYTGQYEACDEPKQYKNVVHLSMG